MLEMINSVEDGDYGDADKPINVKCSCGLQFKVQWDNEADNGRGAWVQTVVKFTDPNQTELPAGADE